jgi:hypothetical protein
MPIPVTENQFSVILSASSALCPSDRDQFLAAVAHELAAMPELGDGAVARAVAVAFRTFFHPPEVTTPQHHGRRALARE